MERARLQLAAKDRVFRAHRVRLDKDRPFMVETLSVPAALFPDLAKANAAALPHVAELAQRHGILLGKAEERVSVETATSDIAKALEIEVGAPVVVLDRVVFGLDRRPVEWRMGRCHLAGGHYLAEMR
jgi:GntR family transcriptional regulator